MKKVVSPSDVAHFWANQTQEEARNSSGTFYFYGPTIYSYGGHFPIATHFEGYVLFTKRTYSVTTGKHISTVRSAASHLNKIYCYYPLDSIESNIEKWCKDIEIKIKEMARARNKSAKYSEIQTLQNEMIQYAKVKKYKLKAKEKSWATYTAEEAEGYAKKIAEARLKELNIIKTKGKKLFEKWLGLWKLGMSITEIRIKLSLSKIDNYNLINKYLELVDYTPLRYNRQDEEIETLKGVKVPLLVAKRYAQAFVDGTIKVGDNILYYSVSKVNTKHIKIGCHTIIESDIRDVLNIK